MNNMKTISNKKVYAVPAIEIVKLDSEICLQLESEPPVGPGEDDPFFSNLQAPEFFSNNPIMA